MTSSLMTDGLPWLLAGAVIGAAYFFLLARSVDAMSTASDWRKAAGYLVLRVAIAVCGFTLAAMQGTAPVLFTLVGLVLARTVAIRRVRRS